MQVKLICMAAISALCSMGAKVYNDAITIESLNDTLLDLNGQAEAIQNLADNESRQLTEAEDTRLNEIFSQFQGVQDDIDRRTRIANQRASLETPAGRKTAPRNNADKENKQYRQPRAADAGRDGFESFGHFAIAVRNAANKQNPQLDPRLIRNAPSTFGSEGVGADGGILVPTDFRTDIQRLVFGDDSIIASTDQQTSTSNNLNFPVDEATPWGSNGIQANWEGEGDQHAQSKFSLKPAQIRLNKITTLVPITEELAEDAAGVDSYLRSKVPEVMDYKINDAIFNGTGAGMPLGINNSGALVIVAKESGQAADTIVFMNIVKMWSRMRAKDRKTAVWYINQDIEPQLFNMSFEGSSSSVPAYMPANGLAGQPYGTLFGRPVIPIENAQTLGDQGDIILANMKQYLTGQKVGGMRTDVSMHLWFDYDTLAYKFINRIAGQPWLSAPIAAANGSNTYSPFITLAERAA